VGACMGLCHSLADKALDLSLKDDLSSVINEIKLYASVCNVLFQEFRTFDFRNGILRRNFDKMKYSVGKMDTLLYDLSFIPVDDANEEEEEKKPVVFNVSIVKEKMDGFDSAREEVIKKSRDILKASKKSITATLQHDLEKAEKLLKEAEKAARELLKTTITNDVLRKIGSFQSALEEMQEAIFILHWVKIIKTDTKEPLVRLDIISDQEYLGGLMDFCGELHRWAVLEATKREIGNVEEALKFLQDTLRIILSIDLGALEKKQGLVEDMTRRVKVYIQQMKFAKARGQEGVSHNLTMQCEGEQE